MLRAAQVIFRIGNKPLRFTGALLGESSICDEDDTGLFTRVRLFKSEGGSLIWAWDLSESDEPTDEELAAREGVAGRTGSTDADIEARGGPVGRGGRGHGRCQRGQGGHHGVEVEFLSGSFPVGDWNPIRNRKQVRFRNPQSELGRA